MKQATKIPGVKRLGYQLVPQNGLDESLYNDAVVTRRCPECHRPLSWDLKQARIRISEKMARFDALYTWDLQTLLSARIASSILQASRTPVEAVEVSDSGYHIVAPKESCEFDVDRRGTVFHNACSSCGQSREVVGAHPGIYKASKLEKFSVYRSDIMFGSLGATDDGIEHVRLNYLLLIDFDLAEVLLRSKPIGLLFDMAYTSLLDA